MFEPTAVRVTSVSATLGAPVQPGQPVLPATSTTRQVSIALDAAQQSEVAVGDKVTITLPNNQTTPGVISSVGTVAIGPGAGQLGHLADHHRAREPDRPGRHRDVGPGTGERDDHDRERQQRAGRARRRPLGPIGRRATRWRWRAPTESRHLVPVTLGLFDDADGLVQVSGSGLAAGERVVVPKL